MAMPGRVAEEGCSSRMWSMTRVSTSTPDGAVDRMDGWDLVLGSLDESFPNEIL
jgi:hypothetical protein